MLKSLCRWLVNWRSIRNSWDLDTPLIRLSRYDAWTIGNAIEGTLILGATGSGKTSGSGAAIAHSFLKAGYGGLVLTVKSDERALWERYCKAAGRSDDLIVFGPEQPHRFNFIDFEVQRKGRGAGLTHNLVSLLETIIEMAERKSVGQAGGGENDGYWRNAREQLSRNLIDLVKISSGSVSIPALYRVLLSTPRSLEQVRSPEFQRESKCFGDLVEGMKREKAEGEAKDFELVADYFLVAYPDLAEKTRSIIVSTFTGIIDVLNRGMMRDLFCTETNITPQLAESGKIILIDMPIKEFGAVGQLAQVIWKTSFQRSIERRNVGENPRPVFLWADEAQFFCTSGDMLFQSTCRSAHVATVLLSQNVPNLYAALGGNQKGKVEADSLFANLNTKIFHANGDSVTNEWAASLIGKSRQFFLNANTSHQGDELFWGHKGFNGPTGSQNSAGMSEHLEFEVQPSEFTTLRTGGRVNRQIVDAIVFQNGKRFHSSDRPWMKTLFHQAN